MRFKIYFLLQIKPIFAKLMAALSTPSQSVSFHRLILYSSASFFAVSTCLKVNEFFYYQRRVDRRTSSQCNNHVNISNSRNNITQCIHLLSSVVHLCVRPKLSLSFPSCEQRAASSSNVLLQVQQAVANCLPPLCGAMKDEAPALVKKLLNQVSKLPFSLPGSASIQRNPFPFYWKYPARTFISNHVTFNMLAFSNIKLFDLACIKDSCGRQYLLYYVHNLFE